MISLLLNIKFWTIIFITTGVTAFFLLKLDFNTIYPSDIALTLTFLPATILTIFVLKKTKFLNENNYVKMNAIKFRGVRFLIIIAFFIVLIFFSYSFFNFFILAINNYVPVSSPIENVTYKILDRGFKGRGMRRFNKYSYVYVNYKDTKAKIKFPYFYYDNLLKCDLVTLTLRKGALGYDIIVDRRAHN